MSYSTGMLRERIHIFVRDDDKQGDFGRNSAGRDYHYACTVWGKHDFDRGTMSMRQGAVNAYETVMFRLRWNNVIDRRSLIVYDGRTFQIKSFNPDLHDNQIQITAVEFSGKNLADLVPKPSTSDIDGDDGYVSESDI